MPLLVGGAARAADEPTSILRIGVSVGLSGEYESIARLQQRAYLLWQKNVNARGGILGRRVQLVIRDDRSDPETARKIYEDFVGPERMDFVLGPYSSAITAAIAPVVDRHGYPTLAPGATADTLWKRGYKNLFGVYSPASRYAIGFLALLAEAGIQRIAIVSATDGFSTEASNGMRAWAPQYGLQVSSFATVTRDKGDMLKVASAAQRSGAQALLVAGHFNEAVEMRKVLKDIGWSPRAYYAATAYAAGQVLEQAIVKAGSFDRAKVRETLYLVDADSVIGRYAVDRTGMQIKRFPMIVQWQGGKREIVSPPELRTAAPMFGH